MDYKELKEGENHLKIDKNLIEIQKTIIHRGDKIIFEIDKLSTLVRTIIQDKERKSCFS